MLGISGVQTILTGERYYTADNAPGFGEVGEWKDKLIKSKPGWNEVLEKAQNAPSARQKFKI